MRTKNNLLLLFTLTLAGFLHGQEEETFKVLTIQTTVTYENVPLEGVSVGLYEGNDPILQEVTKKSGKLKYTLFNDRVYTLQLTKEGYYPKRILISTKVPEDFLDEEKFSFEIGMIAKGGEEIEDEDLLDYPSALIGFHPKYDKFYYDVEYDKKLKYDIQASSRFKNIIGPGDEEEEETEN